MTHPSASSTSDRPQVVVSAMTSLDGRITLRRGRLLMEEETSRKWHSLWPPSAETLHRTRSAHLGEYPFQAVLEGSGSFVRDSVDSLTGLPMDADGPADGLYTDFLPAEAVERPGHEQWFTVVDSRGRVRWDTAYRGGFDVLVLAARATPPEYLAYLQRERISYLVTGAERVDLGVALRRMQERLGVRCVVSTAGGGINGALLRAGLVDEIHLLVLPAAIGGLGTPTVFDGPELGDRESATKLRLLFAHVEADGMLSLRYAVVHEESGTDDE